MLMDTASDAASAPRSVDVTDQAGRLSVDGSDGWLRGGADRRSEIRSEAIGVAAGLRLGIGLHLLDLGLEDPHRLAQRTGRVRKLLGAEEQNEDSDDDYPVPGL